MTKFFTSLSLLILTFVVQAQISITNTSMPLSGDTIRYSSAAYLATGKKYKWVALSYQKKEVAIISKLGFNERFFVNKPFIFFTGR